MNVAVNQIIYALVFLAILLLVEGVYLLVRGSNGRTLAVNRRMDIANEPTTQTLRPSLLRERVLGGPVSQALMSMMPDLEDAFWAANLKITPARALVYCSIGFLVVLAGLLVVNVLPGPAPIFVAAGVAFGLPFLALNIAVGKQRKKFDEQLPDAVNLITRGLQAGHPVPVAFALVAKELPDPIGSEFGNAIDQINFGRDRAAALRDIAKRYPNPEFMFFIAAMEMQRESGGNLVGILDNLVKVIRERSNMKKKALAVSAEGRLTAIIVGSLPYVLGAMLLLISPDFILQSVDDPKFWPSMFGAWLLWLTGIIIIWRMVNIRV